MPSGLCQTAWKESADGNRVRRHDGDGSLRCPEREKGVPVEHTGDEGMYFGNPHDHARRCGTIPAMANDDFGAGVDRLTALIPEDLYTLVEPTSRACVLGWGTMFNVVHYVRGIRALHAAACCASALPLLRAALEYTMCTIWLADEGEEAVEVLNRNTAYRHKTLYDHLDGMDWRSHFPEEVVQNFESVAATKFETHPDETLVHFTHLLAAYGFENWIPIYDDLSMASHATSTGAQRFVRQTGDAFLVAQTVEPPESTVGPCEVWGFGLLLDTMVHYNELLAGKPWSKDLESIAADYGYPVRLIRRKPKIPKSKGRGSRGHGR